MKSSGHSGHSGLDRKELVHPLGFVSRLKGSGHHLFSGTCRRVYHYRAAKMGCINAEHPDSYGHYREAIVTAIKHHWWWKVR